MPHGKTFTAEQIMGWLREAEVELAREKTVPEQTSDRRTWEYGGLRTDHARRLIGLGGETGATGQVVAQSRVERFRTARR